MLKIIDAFALEMFDKVVFLALLKSIMVTKTKLMKRKPRRSHPHEIIVPDKNDEQSKNNVNYETNNTIQIKDSIAHYYQKKRDVNFVLINETKFISSFSWNRVHEYIISFTTLPNNGCKYKICQVKKENDSSRYLDVTASNAYVKESRFCYIRPVDGAIPD